MGDPIISIKGVVLIYACRSYRGLRAIFRLLRTAWDITGYVILVTLIIVYIEVERTFHVDWISILYVYVLSSLGIGIYMLWQFAQEDRFPEVSDATWCTILFNYFTIFCIFEVFILIYGFFPLLGAEYHIYADEPTEIIRSLFILYFLVFGAVVGGSLLKLWLAQDT